MGMERKHLVVIANPRSMPEVQTGSVQLVATSPPCFDMAGCGGHASPPKSFHKYLQDMQRTFSECHRALENGCCICAIVCDTIDCRYSNPSSAHFALLLKRAGFEYREDIIWRKPASLAEKRPYSGSTLGHAIIMRKGGFDRREIGNDGKRQAARDMQEAARGWNPGIQNGDNALPQIPPGLFEPLIRFHTCEGETVLDPFLGNGMAAREIATLGRRLIGYATDSPRLQPIVHGSGIAPHDLKIMKRRCFG